MSECAKDLVSCEERGCDQRVLCKGSRFCQEHMPTLDDECNICYEGGGVKHDSCKSSCKAMTHRGCIIKSGMDCCPFCFTPLGLTSEERKGMPRRGGSDQEETLNRDTIDRMQTSEAFLHSVDLEYSILVLRSTIIPQYQDVVQTITTILYPNEGNQEEQMIMYESIRNEASEEEETRVYFMTDATRSQEEKVDEAIRWIGAAWYWNPTTEELTALVENYEDEQGRLREMIAQHNADSTLNQNTTTTHVNVQEVNTENTTDLGSSLNFDSFNGSSQNVFILMEDIDINEIFE